MDEIADEIIESKTAKQSKSKAESRKKKASEARITRIKAKG